MIAVWLILGLVLAVIIARLNNSNKLFWIAFTSFAFGIAAESMINTADQEEKEISAQVYPTQVVSGSSNIGSFLADFPDTTQSLVPDLVSQDTTPEKSGDNPILEESFKETLTDPPEYHPRIK